MKNRKIIIGDLEEKAEFIFKHARKVLFHFARLSLVSTFVEDSIRMWYQWDDQRDYLCEAWSFHYLFGTLFVIINLFGQLIPCCFIILRKRVNEACYALMGTIFIQTIVYRVLWELQFVLRNLSVMGAILMILVENQPHAKCLFAGLPMTGENKPKNLMQFIGRLLLIIMYLTLIKLDFYPFHVFTDIFGTFLIILVAIGYKTKLSALTLSTILTLINYFGNPFWQIPPDKPLFDYIKFDFFQTQCVIGGLLFVALLGPGSVSIDEHKKKW
jgi:ER-derived vesicles protein